MSDDPVTGWSGTRQGTMTARMHDERLARLEYGVEGWSGGPFHPGHGSLMAQGMGWPSVAGGLAQSPHPLRIRKPQSDVGEPLSPQASREPGPTVAPTRRADGTPAQPDRRAKHDGIIARIVRRIRRQVDSTPPAVPTSDADFQTKIETATKQLAYSERVMRETTERAENLRRIARTGNFVEGWLVPESREGPTK